MPLKRFLMVGLLAAACFICGCVIVWDDPIDDPEEDAAPDNKPNPHLDGRLLGDWLTISEYNDGMEMIEITTLTSSGNMVIGGFLKVEDFWIESWENVGTWRTSASNDTLYELYVEYGEPGVDTVLYAISGNKITLSICAERTCDTTMAEKVDAAAIKSRLTGTIYRQNAALFTSSSYTDLMWRLEGDQNEILDFDMMYFCNGERYFGEGWHYDDDWLQYYDGYDWYDPIWYTDGPSLFLILAIDGYIEKSVELTYNVKGNGSAARLSTRPLLLDGTAGPEDTWLPAEFDDNGRWVHKSKYGKKASKKRRGAFVSSWMPKRAAHNRAK